MTYVESIMNEMPETNKPQREAMAALFMAIQAASGRATMLNLSRYGAGSPRRLARWARRAFNFIHFNMALLASADILNHCVVAAFDPSFISKSGKKTWGLGKFFNSCASKAQKGLESCTVALIDCDEQTAYAVDVAQTPASMPDDQSRIDFYVSVFKRSAALLRPYTRHLVVDGGLTNEKMVTGVTDCGFDIIGKLRHDADMRHLYRGDYSGRGRPRKYTEKVRYDDCNWSEFDEITCEKKGIKGYTAIVNHKTLKRDIRVVVLVNENKARARHALLFSTDLALSGEEIVRRYRLRFQIEFLFRDGKQHTGFGHAQVRDKRGQEFFLNASMTTLNLMRLRDRHLNTAAEDHMTSIMSWKRIRYNEMIVARLSAECGLDLTSIKSHPNYSNALHFGACAA